MKKIALRNCIVSVVAASILGICFLNLSITPSKALGKAQYKFVDTGAIKADDLDKLGYDGIINQYANDGWELVQAYCKPNGYPCFIFKK